MLPRIPALLLAAWNLTAAEPAWREPLQNGDRLMNSGQLAEGIEAFNRSAAAARASGDAAIVGASLERIGVAYAILGRPIAAEASFRRAISVLETCPIACAGALAVAYLDLGAACADRGQYRRARELLTQALAVLGASPENQIAIAAVEMKLATIDNREHRVAEAEREMRNALATLEQAAGRSSVQWICAANNLAVFLWDHGRPREAEPYLREAIARGQTAPLGGLDRVIVAKALLNGFEREFGLRRFDEAESHIARALGILDQTLGADHPLTGRCLVRYAALYRATKRKAEAKVLEARVRSVLRSAAAASVFGASTIDVRDLMAERQ
jgi:tetratricopeptide (TPR) repeat protein